MKENSTMSGGLPADVCIILEGAYPFVSGGVSSWMHDLVKAQGHLRFHLVALTDTIAPRPMRYELPANIVAMTRIPLHQSETRISNTRAAAVLIDELEAPLRSILRPGEAGELDAFRDIITTLRRHDRASELRAILNSEAAFDLLKRMYCASVPGSSFLNYFWSWRSLLGGLFSVLLAPLPHARIFHTISTGYAGLFMARAVIETGHPGILTEHGIYTNERRIEIAMANWLVDHRSASLDIDGRSRDLRDIWTDAFVSYSRICYQACSRITTLYSGNQMLQIRDGAPVDRLAIIPNGIDYAAFASIEHDMRPRPPTVALIGRVVPIKDVKTFIKSSAILRQLVPNVQILVIGPADEDPPYFRECERMVVHLDLSDTVTFTGPLNLKEHLGRIDVIALTSISEAQPLVLLEGGAAGIPCVATNVGSCRDIIEGRVDESPSFGAGGFVVPLADAEACARAVAELLLDDEFRQRCGLALRERVKTHYNKTTVDQTYRRLYEACINTVPSAGPLVA